MGLDEDELGSICYNWSLVLIIFLNVGGGVWHRLSHNSGGIKIIRCIAICLLLLISVPITPDKIFVSSGTINPHFLIKSFRLLLKLNFGSINARKRFFYLLNLLFSSLVSL